MPSSMVHSCNSNTGEEAARRSNAQSHLCLCDDYDASLGYVRPCREWGGGIRKEESSQAVNSETEKIEMRLLVDLNAKLLPGDLIPFLQHVSLHKAPLGPAKK